MTDKRSDERKKLALLADALFDDIFSASDEEILAEIKEAGGDPTTISDQMRIQFEEAVLRVRKERMKEAKQGLRRAQSEASTNNMVDVAVARRAVQHALQNSGISMAARNESDSDLSDEEVLRKYHDLVRLGVIEPQDSGDL